MIMFGLYSSIPIIGFKWNIGWKFKRR